MSAKVFEKDAMEELSRPQLPGYLKSSLDWCNTLGMGPDSDPWRTWLMWVVFIFAYPALPMIAIGETLGHYRYGMYFMLFTFACAIETFWSQPNLARRCVECTPARYLTMYEGMGLDLYREVTMNTFVFMGLWAPMLLVMAISFTFDEVKRQQLAKPGIFFYALVSIWFLLFVLMIVPGLVNGTDFIGEILVREQKTLLEKINARNLTFEEAIRYHRSQHDRHRKVIEEFSRGTTAMSAVHVFSSCFIVYDYFTMSWSHWSMLVFFVMIALSFCIMLPLSWAKVNYAQDELRLTVARGVGPPLPSNHTVPINVQEDDKLEAGRRDYEESELWNAEERTRFLAYLQAYELKVTVFGWELGPGFMAEISILYLSVAFFMWQVTTLSKWTGFSFDVALA